MNRITPITLCAVATILSFLPFARAADAPIASDTPQASDTSESSDGPEALATTETGGQQEYYAVPAGENQIIGNVTLKDGDKTTKLDYVVRPDGDAVFEGDIILGDFTQMSQLGQNETQLAGLSDPGLLGLFRRGNHLWPQGKVRYVIDGALPNPGRITQAIAHWESKTPIRFEAITAETGNYIRFIVDPQGGCSSSVGMMGGRQFVKLGTACSKGNVIHEIGHALGLGHEHIRADRNNFITVKTENIKPGMESQFSIKPEIYMNVGPYDYGSIMHYDKRAFSKNGQLTIISPNPIIGQRNALSPSDICVIKTMYAMQMPC